MLCTIIYLLQWSNQDQRDAATPTQLQAVEFPSCIPATAGQAAIPRKMRSRIFKLCPRNYFPHGNGFPHVLWHSKTQESVFVLLQCDNNTASQGSPAGIPGTQGERTFQLLILTPLYQAALSRAPSEQTSNIATILSKHFAGCANTPKDLDSDQSVTRFELPQHWAGDVQEVKCPQGGCTGVIPAFHLTGKLWDNRAGACPRAAPGPPPRGPRRPFPNSSATPETLWLLWNHWKYFPCCLAPPVQISLFLPSPLWWLWAYPRLPPVWQQHSSNTIGSTQRGTGMLSAPALSEPPGTLQSPGCPPGTGTSCL